MRIIFLLPGHPRAPIGGFQVAYEYANHMARHTPHRVSLMHSERFSPDDGPSDLRSTASALAAAVRAALDRRHRGVPWFRLDPRIEVRHTVGPPALDTGPGDVVIATSAETAFYAAAHIATTGARGLYFVQHFEAWSVGEERARRSLALPLEKVVIAPWLRDVAAAVREPSTLVPNAIDAHDFPPGPPLRLRRPRVLAMFSPNAFKRADVLCEVFALLRAEVPGIALAGFGVAERPACLDRDAEYVRQPTRAHLGELYRTARVYVCASDSEGWHLPPAEALSSGTAVASTDIGGVRAYAEDAALFSPPGDAAALVRNIRRLLDEPDLSQRLTDVGRTRLASYSPDDAARAFTAAVLGA